MLYVVYIGANVFLSPEKQVVMFLLRVFFCSRRNTSCRKGLTAEVEVSTTLMRRTSIKYERFSPHFHVLEQSIDQVSTPQCTHSALTTRPPAHPRHVMSLTGTAWAFASCEKSMRHATLSWSCLRLFRLTATPTPNSARGPKRACSSMRRPLLLRRSDPKHAGAPCARSLFL